MVKGTDAQSVVKDDDKVSLDELCNKVKAITGQCQESLTALDGVFQQVRTGTLLFMNYCSFQ